MNASGAEFQEGRLTAILRANSEGSAGDMIDSVIHATRSFAETDSYRDDFTLVVVKRDS